MHRKQPYSNKKKKQQLQQKRNKKQSSKEPPTNGDATNGILIFTPETLSENDFTSDDPSTPLDGENGQTSNNLDTVSLDNNKITTSHALNLTELGTSLQFASLPKYSLTKFHTQPGSQQNYNNRFQLHFVRESEEEIEARKEFSCLPITFIPEIELELSAADVYPPGTVLDIPKRPPWRDSDTRVTIERAEERMFESYLQEISSQFPVDQLSYFEHNLETWRQFWRVLEISQVYKLDSPYIQPDTLYI